MARCFVTGACGFIGSHLAEALVREGHSVTALALYSARDTFGWLDECAGMEAVRGDVRDGDQMRRLIEGHEIVFHLAATGSVPYSYDSPRAFIDTNVTGTLNVLEAARETGAKVIHTSTSEVYGTARYVPMDEDHPLQAQSPYAASKIAADKLVESYVKSYGLKAVTLRPFNTYGPRQSERAVIARVVRQSLDPTWKSIVLGNLDPKRDFTYISDTVAAFIAAMQLNDGIYNVGQGESINIFDLVKLVTSKPITSLVFQVDHPSFGHLKRPPDSEVMELCADTTKFCEITGWEPKVPLSLGLTYTKEWRSGRTFEALGDVV